MTKDVAATFEEKYQEWKAYCARPDVAESSSDAARVDNRPFQEIVALGEEAIPYIIAKLKEDPDAHFLIHALSRITGRRFTPAEIEAAEKTYGSPLGNQGFARMWIDWWESK